MREYNCPNCGAPIVFRSSMTIHATCGYCRSMVVRHDKNLEQVGQVAELLDDMSPFQVGTTGTYKGMHFTLIGRVKVVYDRGTWSEWVALFDDGRHGWLAEAQGFYMMTFPADDPEAKMPSARTVGKEMKIAGQTYYIEDARNVRYVSTEGELPGPFTRNEPVISIDLRGDHGAFASITVRGSNFEVFVGEYVQFEAMNFQQLRTLDGW